MTASQLRQALRTYTTQGSFRLALLSWLMTHVAALPFFVSVEKKTLVFAAWMFLLGNLNLGNEMGSMLKLQFTNPRARLLPDFRAAHLVVAGGIVGAAIEIEVILVLAMGGAVVSLALFSMTLLVIGVSARSGYWMSIGGPLFLIPLVCAPAFAPGYVAEVIQALSQSPIVCLGIACVGLAAMVFLVARLWMLHEEMPEYTLQMPSRWDFTSRAGNRGWRRLEAQMATRSGKKPWLSDILFDLVLRSKGAMGPLRRLLFAQLAGGFYGLAMMPSLVAALFVLACYLLWILESGVQTGIILVSFQPLPVALSGLGGFWLRRCWPYLAMELLRPLGRRDFVRDLARSMACNMGLIAALHCVMIAVWLKFFSPPGTPREFLSTWLALTAGQYLVAYGVMFWLVSFRSLWVLLLGIFAICSLSLALLMAALFAGRGFWSPLTVAAAIVATGLTSALFHHLAFRRWCQIDLD